jgi:hypothetical protein
MYGPRRPGYRTVGGGPITGVAGIKSGVAPAPGVQHTSNRIRPDAIKLVSMVSDAEESSIRHRC